MFGDTRNGSRTAKARGFVARFAISLTFSLLSAVFASTPVYAQSFSGLGFLPGGVSSVANAVNSDGTAVVGFVVYPAGDVDREAFRWTRTGGMAGLGFLPGGNRSLATGLNADGTVVVGLSGSPSTEEAFLSSGIMGGLGFLPGGFISSASSVNADGTVAVGVSVSPGGFPQEAFRWTQDGMAGLGFLPGGIRSRAQGVNADGTVVVGFSSAGGNNEAFRWTQAFGMAGLGFLPGGNFSEATAVNAGGTVETDGTVVVGSSGNSFFGSIGQAFRWTEAGGMVGLGVLSGGTLSVAGAVNADGTVVVGSGDAPGVNSRAFRWTATDGMQSVQSLLTDRGVATTGWTLVTATGVSADGQIIVGTGIDPDGATQAWIADLGPSVVPVLSAKPRSPSVALPTRTP